MKATKVSLRDWKVEVGRGWGKILDDLERALNQLDLPDDFKVTEVKEKFGVLRVYVYPSTPEVDGAIDKACGASGKTCEWCGKEGVAVCIGYWLKTLCPHCMAESESKGQITRIKQDAKDAAG